MATRRQPANYGLSEKYISVSRRAAMVGTLLGGGLAVIAYRGWLYRGSPNVFRPAEADAPLALHSFRKRFTASQNPRIGYGDYKVDGRLAEDIRLLAESHIPDAIVHVPYNPELKKGKKYILQPGQGSLPPALRPA